MRLVDQRLGSTRLVGRKAPVLDLTRVLAKREASTFDGLDAGIALVIYCHMLPWFLCLAEMAR